MTLARRWRTHSATALVAALTAAAVGVVLVASSLVLGSQATNEQRSAAAAAHSAAAASCATAFDTEMGDAEAVLSHLAAVGGDDDANDATFTRALLAEPPALLSPVAATRSASSVEANTVAARTTSGDVTVGSFTPPGVEPHDITQVNAAAAERPGTPVWAGPFAINGGEPHVAAAMFDASTAATTALWFDLTTVQAMVRHACASTDAAITAVNWSMHNKTFTAAVGPPAHLVGPAEAKMLTSSIEVFGGQTHLQATLSSPGAAAAHIEFTTLFVLWVVIAGPLAAIAAYSRTRITAPLRRFAKSISVVTDPPGGHPQVRYDTVSRHDSDTDAILAALEIAAADINTAFEEQQVRVSDLQRLYHAAMKRHDHLNAGIADALHAGPIQEVLLTRWALDPHQQELGDSLSQAAAGIRAACSVLHPVAVEVDSGLSGVFEELAAAHSNDITEVICEVSPSETLLTGTEKRTLLRSAQAWLERVATEQGAPTVHLAVNVHSAVVTMSMTDSATRLDPPSEAPWLASQAEAAALGGGLSRERSAEGVNCTTMTFQLSRDASSLRSADIGDPLIVLSAAAPVTR